MRGTAQLLAFLSLAVVGCTGVDRKFDFDGDGFDDSEDCAPEDPSTHPGADDPYGDDRDANCDGLDGLDADGDGYPGNEDLSDQPDLWDCNDADSDTYPGAEDVPDDGIDQDCDGLDLVDADDDGHPDGVTDCDDSDATVYLDAPELPDGKDNDCDGSVDEGTDLADDDGDGSCEGFDLDGDGADECSDGSDPGDCDDGDPALNLSDIDVDGHDTCGGDCDDFNQDVSPGAPEVCNGEDDDCDGSVSAGELDVDLDGYAICEGDCEDSNPAVHPGDTDGDGFTLCDPTPDCDDEDSSLTPEDSDLDQYSSCSGDCDDTDPFVYLGAVERCNGLDDDCDGAVPADEVDGDGDSWLACQDCDDGDVLFYGLDEDGDGLSMCVGDCDDGNAGVYPGAFDGWGNGQDEDCSGEDGVDWDGDGAVANATPPGLGTPEWDCDDFDAAQNRSDLDGDGVDTCASPPDCDDTNPLNYPSNSEDSCDGSDTDCVEDLMEQDNDGDGWMECDGDCDDGNVLLSGADADSDGVTSCGIDGLAQTPDDDCDDTDPGVFPGNIDYPCDALDSDCVYDGDEVDDDGDGWMECGGDCDDTDPLMVPIDTDGDGWTLCDGDCDDADPSLFPGALLWEDASDGLDADCDGTSASGLAFADFYWTGEGVGYSSGRVAGVGDVDGDGVPDIAIGAPMTGVSPSALRTGRTYVVSGASAMSGPVSAAEFTLVGGDSNGQFGKRVVGIGDVDGDSLADLLIRGYNTPPTLATGATVSTPTPPASLPVSTLDLQFSPTEYGLGAAGDLDADGLDDFVIGYAGSGQIYLGSTITAAIAASSAPAPDVVLTAEDGADQLYSLDSAGDVDGDGLPDLIVGVWNSDAAGPMRGKSYVLRSTGALAGLPPSISIGGAGIGLEGESDDDWSGLAVAGVGDVDGDGLDDILVGAPRSDGGGSDAGRAYLLLGAQLATLPSGTSVSLSSADVIFDGEDQGDRAGWSVASAGDMDADGRGDFLIGAYLAEPGGKVYVVLASFLDGAGWPALLTLDDVPFAWAGEASGDGAGYYLDSAGDFDGDGKDDIVIGAPNRGIDIGYGTGKAYVVLSPF